MVDRELNDFDNTKSAEEFLRSFRPQPLAIESGQVMFEAGKAVGREQALAESQTRLSRSLTAWRIAAAASLALALFSLIGQLNPPVETKNSVVEKVDARPEKLTKNLNDKIDEPSKTESKSVAYPPTRYIQPTSIADSNTIIGLQNQLLSTVFEPNAEIPTSTEKFAFEQPMTAIELLRQYTSSEEL